MTTPKRVYMAGPLFSLADRRQNEDLAMKLTKLCPDVAFVLPQVRAVEMLPDLAAVVLDCFEQTADANLVLANLDGADSDSGTCVEIGYALGRGIPVVGYRTDFRASEEKGVNAMLAFGVTEMVVQPSYAFGLEDLANVLAEKVRDRIKKTV